MSLALRCVSENLVFSIGLQRWCLFYNLNAFHPSSVRGSDGIEMFRLLFYPFDGHALQRRNQFSELFSSDADRLAVEEQRHADNAPAPLAARLLQATEQIYRDHQLQANSNPAILGYHFEIYREQDKSIPKVGEAAPLVEGKNQSGQTWRLVDDIGKKVVLLYFYPKDGTQGCTKEACGLRDRMGDLAKDNVEVIGVSFDSTDSHQAFISKYSLNFPLLADTDGKIADAYGVRMEGKSLDKRVSFLIGLDGKIAHVTDTPSADVHLAEMQDAVEKLPKNLH